MPHYYRVLNIAADANADEIKAAFRNLAKSCHPDTEGGGDTLRFREVRQAYSVLSDPVQRAAYDARCAGMRSRAQRRLAGAAATMAASFALTVSSGVAVAGWLLGT